MTEYKNIQYIKHEKIQSKILLLFNLIKLIIIQDEEKSNKILPIKSDFFDLTSTHVINGIKVNKRKMIKVEIEKLSFILFNFYDKTRNLEYFINMRCFKILNSNKNNDSIPVHVLYTLILYLKLLYDVYSEYDVVDNNSLRVCNKLWYSINTLPENTLYDELVLIIVGDIAENMNDIKKIMWY